MKLMSARSDFKTATESEKDAVIDALKLAFVADPATRWVWPNPQKYLLHFSKFARALGEGHFRIRPPIMSEIIQVWLYGFLQMLALMLKPYLNKCKKLNLKKLKQLFHRCLRKWRDFIQTNLIGIFPFLA